MLWVWDRMVLVSVPFCPIFFLPNYNTPVVSSFLTGFLCPLMWYYATILYFGNHYRKDPRERAGLAASAIAVSTLCLFLLCCRIDFVNWDIFLSAGDGVLSYIVDCSPNSAFHLAWIWKVMELHWYRGTIVCTRKNMLIATCTFLLDGQKCCWNLGVLWYFFFTWAIIKLGGRKIKILPAP